MSDVEVPTQGDDSWEGPWMNAPGRRLTASEARIYSLRCGLTPVEAASWCNAGIGPYAAQRSIEEGLDLETAVSKLEEADRLRKEKDRAESWPELGTQRSKKWRSAGFNSLDEIEGWIGCEIGPSSARRWISAGVSDPLEAFGWSEAGLDVSDAAEWLQSDFNLDEVLSWVANLFPFDLSEATRWRDAGLSPDDAALWASTGLSPTEAKEELAAGRGIRDVLESIPESQVLIWGGRDPYQIVPLDFAKCCRDNDVFVEQVLSAGSWEELAEVVRPEDRSEFDLMVEDEWRRHCEEFESVSADEAEPPVGWLPSSEPGGGEWSWEQPRVNDPDCLDELGDILELGNTAGHMLHGEFISWDFDAIREASRIARATGYAFVRNDDLVDGRDCVDFPFLDG